MSSPIVIGHLGFSGQVGSSVLPHLLEFDQQGIIKLVILHRESTDLSKLPDGIEKRLIDLSENGLEVNKRAVQGLQVVLSTVRGEAFKGQTYLIDALAGSPTLKTFIDSDFGLNWTDEEIEAPGLRVIGTKKEVVKHAEEKGVPTTHIRVGAFDKSVFRFKASGTDFKGNVVQVFRDSLRNPYRITSLPYLGFITAQLVLSPDSLPGKTYQVYDYAPTGQDLIDVLTELHGAKPLITEFTEKEYEEGLKTPGALAIVAGTKAKWGDNTWGASGNVPDYKGWKSKSFEDFVADWEAQL